MILLRLLVGREDALVHESGKELVIVCLLGCRGLALEGRNLLVLIICRTTLSSLGLQMADSCEYRVALVADVSPLATIPAPNDMHPPPPSCMDLRYTVLFNENMIM